MLFPDVPIGLSSKGLKVRGRRGTTGEDLQILLKKYYYTC